MTASKAARFVRKFVRQAAFPAILLLTCLARLSAQGVTAAVTGTVADSTGAVVPRAVVRIENTATHEGRYSFQELRPGNYSLTANMSGFAGFTVKQIQLAAGDSPRVGAALRAGATSDEVQVAARVSALQTDTTNVGSTIAGRAVQGIPINGRNLMVEVPETVKVIAWRDEPGGRVLTPKRTGDRMTVKIDRVDILNVVDELSPGSSCHRSTRFPLA
jgi:hypothetical protein